MRNLKATVNYLLGKHVHVDMSDRNPGDEGTVRCFKCQAERHFTVGVQGGIYYGRWEREGRPAPRCELDHFTCAEKGCGARIFIPPDATEFTCPNPKCKTVYGRVRVK